jgi:calcineurin-like phosphoesterase family protein
MIEKLFFTADAHFGRHAVIKYGNRPFANVDEMDAELIRRWNVVVPPDGEVWHLGDVSFRRNAETLAILKRLNGRKHLIEGNHDHLNREIKAQFQSIADYRELKIDGRKICLFHYPLESWNQMAYGAWHLHGHSHGNLAEFGLRADVGVDCWSQAPVSYGELVKHMAARAIVARDHHTSRMPPSRSDSSQQEEI